MASLKEDMRQKVRTLLSQWNDDMVRDLSAGLGLHLQSLFDQQLKDLNKNYPLGVYAPMKREIDWAQSFSWPGGTAYPGTDSVGTMQFYTCSQTELVESNDFGVKLLVPPESASVVVPEALLIPGMAFSPAGERLGKGKGYYDKYLEHYTGIKIGISFGQQIFSEIAVDDHDIKMDYVVTDQGLVKSGR